MIDISEANKLNNDEKQESRKKKISIFQTIIISLGVAWAFYKIPGILAEKYFNYKLNNKDFS